MFDCHSLFLLNKYYIINFCFTIFILFFRLDLSLILFVILHCMFTVAPWPK